MDPKKVYLAILSKVMREDPPVPDDFQQAYNELYSAIHEDLARKMSQAQYPRAPTVVSRMERLLDDIEQLCNCRELIGTASLLIANYTTSQMFHIMRGLFSYEALPKELGNIHTQIPFVVVNGLEPKIEAVNYADCRSALSISEYKTLLQQSGLAHVALNKIVKFFLVTIPMRQENISLIFDNIYADAELMFHRTICRKIYRVNGKSLPKIKSGVVRRFDCITCSEFIEPNARANPELSKKDFIPESQLISYCAKQISPVLYGFMDEFRVIQTQVESYLRREISDEKDDIQKVIQDIVRSGDKNDQKLNKIREELRKSTKELTESLDCIFKGFHIAERKLNKIIEITDDYVCDGKLVPDNVVHNIFESLFCGNGIIYGIGGKTLSRLTTISYPRCDLVEAYLRDRPADTIEFVPVQKQQWEQAKMYIAIADLNSLPQSTLQNYVEVLAQKKHITTGKEHFARWLVGSENRRFYSLKESFACGYMPAAKILVDLYKKGDKRVNIKNLANELVPEACMIVAHQIRQRSGTNFIDIRSSSPFLTYLKIAAAQKYLPAIAEIVEEIYNRFFSGCFQILAENRSDPQLTFIIENGHILIALCQYLLDKQYMVTRYRECLGVTYYCLNENLSDAMSLLGGIDSGAANFCKGRLYEFGNGTIRNYEQALSHYQRAYRMGFNLQITEKQIRRCQSKIRRVDQERANQNNQYNRTESYHSQKTETSRSSDGCFITTATCLGLQETDECEELNMLRNFRDAYIQRCPEGQFLVYEYYRVAPEIVQQINQLDDAKELYKRLWTNYIAPSCQAIKEKKLGNAEKIYVQMVLYLCQKFQIKLRPKAIAYAQTIQD